MLAAGAVPVGRAVSSSKVALAGTLRSGAFLSPSRDGPGWERPSPLGPSATAQEPLAQPSGWAQVTAEHSPTQHRLLVALAPCVP